MAEVIKVTGLQKSFGKDRVLKGIELSVPEHSVFAFLGNNGAGKSTTIRILTGLLAADAGEVRVLGMNVQTEMTRILQQVGALVDSPALYPNLTAAEFLGIACSLKRTARSEIDRVLAVVELVDARHRRIQQFSLGMKQRLALALALVGQPKLLLLDEPTNGLDPQGMQDMRELLKTLPEQTGCTIFVSSHLLDEVEKIASHVAVIVDGRVTSQVSLQDLHQQLDSCLILQGNQAEQTARVLDTAGFTVIPDGGQQVSVSGATKTDTPQILRLLMAEQIDVYEVRWQRRTLEDWFLAEQKPLNKQMLTGTGEAAYAVV